MVLSEVHDDRYQHGEGLLLIGLKDIQEVVVLEKAHGAVGYLEVDATNALDYAFEEFRNQWFNFLNFAYF